MQSAFEKDHYTTFQVLAPLVTNVFACVSVVLVNKFVMKNWPFGYTLTCIHFTTTFCVLFLLCKLKVFEHKKLSIPRVLPLSLMFLLSIVLNNLSIQHNSVCPQPTTFLLYHFSLPIGWILSNNENCCHTMCCIYRAFYSPSWNSLPTLSFSYRYRHRCGSLHRTWFLCCLCIISFPASIVVLQI